MKTRFLSLVLGGLLAIGALTAMVGPAFALDPYDAPVVTCQTSGLYKIVLKVCGGANTGAPAGVTVQYKKLSDFQVSGWDDDGTLCKLSLSGQPSLQHPDKSRWELLAGECETVTIGDINFDETGVSGNDCSVRPLACGTDYVFRAFAHAGRRMARSDWTADVVCSTLPCENGCTLTQGFWGTHGPDLCHFGNNENAWPASSLTLGSVVYNATEICAILSEPSGGNGLVSLAHQLIAAKFNVLNGADGSCIQAIIAASDQMIGNLVIYPVGSGFLAPKVTSKLANQLDDYNNGLLCEGHCRQPQGSQLNGSASGKKSTWGTVKTIYR